MGNIWKKKENMSGKEWGDERKLTQPTFGGVES